MADTPTTTEQLVAVVSSVLADPGPDDRELLTSVVGITRAIFGAAASSVFLRTPDGRELTFEAVVGSGVDELVGTRFPADRGIAGWVASTGEPMIVDDLSDNTVFAADFAHTTGYVPRTIMAVPVAYADEVLGVLEVLDPTTRPRAGVSDLDLLAMIAAQAGLALRGLLRHRSARAALHTHGAAYAQLAEIVGLFEQLDPVRRTAGLTLLAAVHTLLRQ
jgi:GAF domain-containing protein